MVLVDGLGGAGKSFLAAVLAAQFDAPVIQGDEFYRPSVERQQSGSEPGAIEASFDWRRLELQVLAPLSRGEEARYQRYDWESDRLGGWERREIERAMWAMQRCIAEGHSAEARDE